MNFIQKLQNKPDAEKQKIIWTTAAVVAVILILVWIFAPAAAMRGPKDTRLFQTIGRGVKDLSK